MINIEQIKKLRDFTGVSIAECRRSLEEANGDWDKAISLLRAASRQTAGAKSDRALASGLIGGYIHTNGQIGSLVSLRCETDFVARHSEFKELADDLAMHVAAFAPASREELLSQLFVKEQNRAVGDVLADRAQKFGERIEIGDFSRLNV